MPVVSLRAKTPPVFVLPSKLKSTVLYGAVASLSVTFSTPIWEPTSTDSFTVIVYTPSASNLGAWSFTSTSDTCKTKSDVASVLSCGSAPLSVARIEMLYVAASSLSMTAAVTTSVPLTAKYSDPSPGTTENVSCMFSPSSSSVAEKLATTVPLAKPSVKLTAAPGVANSGTWSLASVTLIAMVALSRSDRSETENASNVSW